MPRHRAQVRALEAQGMYSTVRLCVHKYIRHCQTVLLAVSWTDSDGEIYK